MLGVRGAWLAPRGGNSMTEAEWLACGEPTLIIVRTTPSDRKARLFAVACCRRVWTKLKNKWFRNAVEVAERLADGLCAEEEVLLARTKASDVQFGDSHVKSKLASGCAALVLDTAGLAATYCGVFASELASWYHSREDLEERAAQAALVRDIFGNPFHPATFLPEWGASTALAPSSADVRLAGLLRDADSGRRPPGRRVRR